MAKAKKVKKGKAGKKKGSGLGSTFLIMVSLAALFFMKTSFLFFIIGMLPSIVVYYSDRTPKRRLSKTVFYCNMAGVASYTVDLVYSGNSLDMFIATISQPMNWLIIYGSAAIGWVLVWFCPIMSELVIDGFQKGKVMQLENSQKKLIEEWGTEVQKRD